MRFIDKLRTQKLLSFTLILFTLAFGIVIGTLVNPSVRAEKDNNAAPGATPLVIPNPVELSNTFSTIAKQVEPSVVNIQSDTLPKQRTQARSNNGGNRRRQQQQQSPDDDNGGMDLFRFFGNPFGGGGGGMMPQSRGSSAVGSGVVVDRAGYILTNNHVVDGADRIRVKFMDSPKEYEAKVVGVDEATDLAVIRVEGGHDFVPAKIGNSDAVQVGDWAVAIGSPFGFQATVTAGIISAKQRDVAGESQFQHFLQTDAAINPGNSGGPLLNIRGEVIGINTAIASESGGYEGIGFAMPINTAANVYNEIIKSGKVTRGAIGVNYGTNAKTTQALLKAAGVNEGVFVDSVQPGGPAEKAGIKPGDVIVALNGKPIRDGNELVNVVSNTPVGTAVNLEAVREGKKSDFKVIIADRNQVVPDQLGKEQSMDSNKSGGTSVSFGMSVQALTDLRRQNLGIKESGGLEVTEVEPSSFADDIGLAAGDILLTINNRPLNSIQDLKDQQAKLKPGDAVAFRVMTAPRDAFGRRGEWTTTYRAGELPTTPR
jgi:serine protease Do